LPFLATTNQARCIGIRPKKGSLRQNLMGIAYPAPRGQGLLMPTRKKRKAAERPLLLQNAPVRKAILEAQEKALAWLWLWPSCFCDDVYASSCWSRARASRSLLGSEPEPEFVMPLAQGIRSLPLTSRKQT